ncbi:MAG: VanZ family protein [Candidatus Omnitrophica bacterium]|nr:VanZ family protein [Candidatus Omnitrophota bacterium]
MAVKRSNFIFLLIWRWLPVLACMGFIFKVSSVPGRDIPALFKYQDILYHLASYAILTLLFSRALAKSAIGIKGPVLLILAIAFGLLYGASDELHQLFVPGRSCSAGDLLVDGIGSLLGGLPYLCH